MRTSRIAPLAAAAGLLAGCHWLFGHTPGGNEDGTGRDRAIRDDMSGEPTRADALGDGSARDLPMVWPGDLAKLDAKKLSDKMLSGDSVTPTPIAPTCAHARLLGGSLPDQAGQVIVDSSQGDVYLAGTFRDSVNFGAGAIPCLPSAGVLAAYTSTLAFRWVSTTGQTANGVTLLNPTTLWTVGSVDVLGDSQIQLTPFATATGAGSGVKIGGAGVESGNAIASAAGELLVAGSYGADFATAAGPLGFRGLGLDALLLEANGSSATWGIGFGSMGLDEARAVSPGSGGVLFVGGRYSPGCWFGPGNPSLQGSSLGSAFVVKIDTRAVAWPFAWGGTGANAALALAAAPNGGVYAAGYFSGSITLDGKNLTATKKDLILIKLDGVGKVQWWVHGFGSEDDEATGLALDASGNVYLVGTTGSGSLVLHLSTSNVKQTLPSKAPPDPILASFTSGGVHRWSRTIEGSGKQRGKSLAVNATDRLVVAGETEQGFAPGGACAWLNPNGASDVFLLSLAP